MPPPGYEPFLRAICESPADDTVRLVYADWLDENDDPVRAEFIRLQITFDRGQANAGRDRDLFARYLAACRHLEHWKGELPKLQGISWPGFFRRGFEHEIGVSDGRHLLRQRRLVFDSTPVDSASIANAGLQTVERILELPEIGRLSHLWLHRCRVQPGEWGVVASCPRLARLNFLGLSWPERSAALTGPRLADDDIATLVASPFLPRGMKLHLQGWVSAEAAAMLRARFAEVIVGLPQA